MVTRHRVNLTFSEQEFAHLVKLAEARGKMPTTFVADLVKAAIYGPSMLAQKPEMPIEQPKPAPVAPQIDIWTQPLPGVEEKPLSRQERRALERGKQKKRG